MEAKRKILYERIGGKRKGEKGGEWFYSINYRDKYEFVRKLFKSFQTLPADIRIDSSAMTPPEVYKVVRNKLEIIVPEFHKAKYGK